MTGLIVLFCVLIIVARAKANLHWQYIRTNDPALKSYRSFEDYKRRKPMDTSQDVKNYSGMSFLLIVPYFIFQQVPSSSSNEDVPATTRTLMWLLNCVSFFYLILLVCVPFVHLLDKWLKDIFSNLP